jgi:3-deoxy-D-manno-octulosonic-acid transferase
MPNRLPALLRAYRVLTTLATPFAPLLSAQRLQRGKEMRGRLSERRGDAGFDRAAGPLVWIHGASVGEITSVIPLIERIRAQHLDVLVTSGTVTSAALVQQRLPRSVVHQFVPLDTVRYVRRFLRHWQPDLALLVESDLWPNLILEATGHGTPMILVNGRLSERSFRRWRRFPGTIRSLLERFDLCLARSQGDAEWYRELGAPHIVTTGNLKFDVPAPPAQDADLQALRMAVQRRPLIGAASTHPGEETIVIEAHRRLRRSVPGLLTIIAPRHPDRGGGVAEISAAAGLKSALRSRGEMPLSGVDIYIADTVGELGLLYRLVPIVFIGGSLVRHGGQNPIEAAKLGAAILHGPHVGNFADIYAQLDDAGGARMVNDGAELADKIAAWLGNPDERSHTADNARATVEQLGGALDRTLQALDPYLMQLRLGGGDRRA